MRVGTPTLFCHLHPAAEEVEISLLDAEHIVVSANTTTVGPGYHIFLASLLQSWGKEFNAFWDEELNASDEYGDETDFFFTGDRKLLDANMIQWLAALCNTFFDGSFDSDDRGIALCMPFYPRFESQSQAIAALGPRSLEWLYEASRDGTRGKDFFAWRDPGLNAEYYLGRALTQMWVDVRWRPPVNEAEETVLKDVLASLSAAYRLNSALPFPWPEWAELLDLLNADSPERDLARLHAHGTPAIGYRRGAARVGLPGGWAIRIPGSFSEFEPDGESALCALDPPREISFTAYRSTEDSTKEFEKTRKRIKKTRPGYLLDREDCIGHAAATNHRRDSGGEYFVLNSSTFIPGGRCVCTIVFPRENDTDWAVEIWRSLQAPSSRNL